MTENEQKNKQLSSFQDEPSLNELFKVLWSKRLFIVSVSFIFSLLTVFYSLTLVDEYRSESILTSVNSQNSPNINQYSGLAALAGVSLPSAGDDQIIEMIELIKSREFVKHLISFDGVLPALMAAEGYNLSTNKISFDSSIFDEKEKKWVGNNFNNKSQPSYLDAHKEYISDTISISRDLKTGLIYISVEHLSPIFAKEFLNLIINEANSLKRNKDIENSQATLEYLYQELSKTSLFEVKSSINKLIETQLERQMMARINEEYSLVIIEPPFVPQDKSKPSRSLIVILGTFLGGLITVVWVLVRFFLEE